LENRTILLVTIYQHFNAYLCLNAFEMLVFHTVSEHSETVFRIVSANSETVFCTVAGHSETQCFTLCLHILKQSFALLLDILKPVFCTVSAHSDTQCFLCLHVLEHSVLYCVCTFWNSVLHYFWTFCDTVLLLVTCQISLEFELLVFYSLFLCAKIMCLFLWYFVYVQVYLVLLLGLTPKTFLTSTVCQTLQPRQHCRHSYCKWYWTLKLHCSRYK